MVQCLARSVSKTDVEAMSLDDLEQELRQKMVQSNREFRRAVNIGAPAEEWSRIGWYATAFRLALDHLREVRQDLAGAAMTAALRKRLDDASGDDVRPEARRVRSEVFDEVLAEVS